MEEIKGLKHELNFATDTQTILYLLRTGIGKIKPLYVAKKKSEVIKLKEKKEAMKLAERWEREELDEKITKMRARRVNRDGHDDAEGEYIHYNCYSFLNGVPPRILIFTEKNPIAMIDEIIERQCEGLPREQLFDFIENKVEGKDWIKAN